MDPSFDPETMRAPEVLWLLSEEEQRKREEAVTAWLLDAFEAFKNDGSWSQASDTHEFVWLIQMNVKNGFFDDRFPIRLTVGPEDVVKVVHEALGFASLDDSDNQVGITDKARTNLKSLVNAWRAACDRAEQLIDAAPQRAEIE